MIDSAPMYSINYHKPERLARLTWLAGTQGITDQDFKETLEAFAESAVQHRAERLVIDVREFKHPPSAEILAWLDDVTVGKHNQAGVKRLAWVGRATPRATCRPAKRPGTRIVTARPKPRHSPGSWREGIAIMNSEKTVLATGTTGRQAA